MSAGTTVGVRTPAGHLLDRARTVAQTAAAHADDVDQLARFPHEAVAAMRTHRLLSACAPTADGGDGAALPDLLAVADTLARACASTAMIWAMHQIQLACLTRHGHTPALRAVTRDVCTGQLLLASATSEVGTGGDLRSSIAAVETHPAGRRITKQAATVSYGAHADGVLATLRRSPDAAPGDQVLVLLLAAETTLEPLSGWDTLGMRGTCSGGFTLRADVDAERVLPDPFGDIAAQTMVPYSHLLWSACWLGLADAALDRARQSLRRRARKSPADAAPAVSRLAHVASRLAVTRSAVDAAARHHTEPHTAEQAGSWPTAVGLNEIKYAASQTAVEVTLEALHLCGFAGYQERSALSVARHLRDALSAPLMISNDRLLSTNGAILVSGKTIDRPW
ncbi:acyl-CoA dehydrogenase family protein [Dactylosporangium sp. NPDC050688]|uniref:acyl-CoA dehydrogenase family protein n=1 Tax=Dactylosporangium sp. NPDC050688 TaxID=3157217 RepID=UPI0033CD9A8D